MRKDDDRRGVALALKIVGEPGELLIFVNDAVIGLPRLYDAFYRNNVGTGLLTVKRR